MATLTTTQQEKVHRLLRDWEKDPASSLTIPAVFENRPNRYEAIAAIDAELSSTAGNVGGQNIAGAVKQALPTASAFDGANLRTGLSNAQIAYLLAAIAVIRAELGVV